MACGKRKLPMWSVCERCGETFAHYKRTDQRFCGRACWYKRNELPSGHRVCQACRLPKPLSDFTPTRAACKPCAVERTTAYFQKLKRDAFVKFVAMQTASNHADGNQKELRLALEAKIEQALGSPCGYCGTELTETTVSGDHITPVSRGGSRSDPANIHIVCLRCNLMKGNISHEGFKLVLAFSPTLAVDDKKILEARLLSGHSRFTRKRG